MYQRNSGSPDTQRYEVQASEDGWRVEMTALGDNNPNSTVVYTFKEGDHDTLESTTGRTDGNGTVIYTGTAVAA